MAMQSTAARPARQLSLEQEIADSKRARMISARTIVCIISLLLSDVLTGALALELAVLVRIQWLPRIFSLHPVPVYRFMDYLPHSWVWLLLIACYIAEGLYTQRRTFWTEVGYLTKATSLGIVGVLAAIALGKLGLYVSRATIVLTGLILLFLMPFSRYWTKRLLGLLNLWRRRILVLSAGDAARPALQGLKEDPVLGYHVVGVLDDDPRALGRSLGASYGQPVLVLGRLALAPQLLCQNLAEDTLVAVPGMSDDQLVRLVNVLRSKCESIYVVPNLRGLPMMNLRVDGFLRQQVLMLKFSNNLVKPLNNFLKRTFDLVVGSLLTLIGLPLMGVIALLVKVTSKGPVLFVQERIGHRGELFPCLKFRTMFINGDEQIETYLERNPHLAAEWHAYAKLKSTDPRLTSIGRFLRRWSLDEVPQLINVLKGDMSLVGPRPYLPREKDRIGEEFATIVAARPGMTGFWQVNGKNHLTLDDRVRLEAWYARNWKIWLDIIILVKTVKTVLLGEGTY